MEEEVAAGTPVPEEVGVSLSKGGGGASQGVAEDEDVPAVRVVKQLPELEGSWRSIMRKWGNGEWFHDCTSSKVDFLVQRAAGRLVGRMSGFKTNYCLLS